MRAREFQLSVLEEPRLLGTITLVLTQRQSLHLLQHSEQCPWQLREAAEPSAVNPAADTPARRTAAKPKPTEALQGKRKERVYARKRVGVCVCVCLRVYACVCVCMRVYACVYVCVYV